MRIGKNLVYSNEYYATIRLLDTVAVDLYQEENGLISRSGPDRDQEEETGRRELFVLSIYLEQR